MNAPQDALAALLSAAEAVVWFDWSANDDDAVAAIDRLRKTVECYRLLSARESQPAGEADALTDERAEMLLVGQLQTYADEGWDAEEDIDVRGACLKAAVYLAGKRAAPAAPMKREPQVPREPTQEMSFAGLGVIEEYDFSAIETDPLHRLIWRAMYDAATAQKDGL